MNLINFGDPRLFTYYALFISIRFGLTFNLMPTKKCEHVTTETMNDVNTVSTTNQPDCDVCVMITDDTNAWRLHFKRNMQHAGRKFRRNNMRKSGKEQRQRHREYEKRCSCLTRTR